MQILELFAGSCIMSETAKELGHITFAVDKEPFEKIDLVKDILDLQEIDIPFIPEMIWASPPCTSFSIAAVSHHRNNQEPKSEFAKYSDELVKKTLEIIGWYDCIYFIENPVGMLRKMDYMKGLPRATVTYCKYGDTRMKPTDIWSNHIHSFFNPKGWQPREKCHNGNKQCHHEPAPRGSKTGTQGLANDYERSKLPKELCKEILESQK